MHRGPWSLVMARGVLWGGVLFVSILLSQRSEASPAVLSSEFVYEPGPYPSCHASTIVETSAGSLLSAWFGGSGESQEDVLIYLSRCEGGMWTEGVPVADGVQHEQLRYPTWNPVLFQSREGPLLLFYKVGPWPAAWWGMLTISEDDGRTWSHPRRLPEGVYGPIKNKPIQLEDGTIICPSSSEDPGPGGSGWQVQIELTQDLGKTWSVVGPLNTKDEFNAIQPSILSYPEGRLQLLCRTMERELVTSWSEDNGRTWSRLSPTGLLNPNSGSDAVTLADGRQLLVYNRREEPDTVRRVDESDRCPLNVAISEDGIDWRMVLVLEDRPRPAGYAYPAVIQAKDGTIHVTYTWDRQRIKHVVLDPTKLGADGSW